MTDLTARLSDVARHIDYNDEADIPRDVYDCLNALVERVEEQAEALQNLRELMAMRGPTQSAGLSRIDALKMALEHVETMSTNSRSFQDGVKMHDKVQATERFARFLMGESERASTAKACVSPPHTAAS
ncbi:hypothetical protein AB0E81_11345 [Streptomyces sp. NPDC033538]|uniref:hypothetical protein n=1 Tax=Streptomyces sp. NPDC033538 TaxID=3155367 RepID=UPI0033E74E64